MMRICCQALLALSSTPFLMGQTAPKVPPGPRAPSFSPTARARPFLMGFTRWPPDYSLEAFRVVDDFLAKHADLITVHNDGGVPWPEALDGRPFSRDVQFKWTFRRPRGHKLFVALTPLNINRDGLAPYWGKQDNQPLPGEWRRYALNSPQVIKAFTNYARRAVAALKPDFLAIGIESNMLLTKNRRKWAHYKELHRKVYWSLKREHPGLPIFFTVEFTDFMGFNSAANTRRQQSELMSLISTCDIFAISFYPYLSAGVRQPYSPTLFNAAIAMGKPLAISETGFPSRTFQSLDQRIRGSEKAQRDWYVFLLRQAARHRFRFVVNWTSTDFPRLLEKMPREIQPLGRLWVYTGLQHDDGRAKRALDLWDAWLRRPMR